MRLLIGSIVSFLLVIHASGCNTVDPDECWPNTSGGLGGARQIPIGAGVGATSCGSSDSPNGGAVNPCVTPSPAAPAAPAAPANAYVNCKARGLDAGACSLACGDVGAACGAVAAHPYKSGQGSGQLTYCKNGWPSYTCTYTFANGDGCVANVTDGGVFWLCAYAGGK